MQIDSLINGVAGTGDHSGLILLIASLFGILALFTVNYFLENGLAKLFGFRGFFDACFKLFLVMAAAVLALISATGIFEQKVSGFLLNFKPIESILLPNDVKQAVIYMACSAVLLAAVLFYGLIMVLFEIVKAGRGKRWATLIYGNINKESTARKFWIKLLIIYNIVAVVCYVAIRLQVINPKIDLFRHAIEQKLSK